MPMLKCCKVGELWSQTDPTHEVAGVKVLTKTYRYGHSEWADHWLGSTVLALPNFYQELADADGETVRTLVQTLELVTSMRAQRFLPLTFSISACLQSALTLHHLHETGLKLNIFLLILCHISASCGWCLFSSLVSCAKTGFPTWMLSTISLVLLLETGKNRPLLAESVHPQ